MRLSRLRPPLETLMVAVTCAACVEGERPDDDGATAAVQSTVSCGPALTRFPIAAPHNIGYDAAWNTFTCTSGPGNSRANSDYGGDHHGIDLFAARGEPIVSVVDGVVLRAGWPSNTSGNRVVIQDACGWAYYAGHLDSIAEGIEPGVRVSAGQVIGTLGDTGTEGTAPHVHFNLSADDRYSDDIDPFPALFGVEHTACAGACDAHCEGSVVVDDFCGRGDCGVFGAMCVDDDRGPRCAYPGLCPLVGERPICLSASELATCRDGLPGDVGDCSVYGAGCVDDDLGARCVFFACRPMGGHDTCFGATHIGRCDDGSLVTQGECVDDTVCVLREGVASCLSPEEAEPAPAPEPPAPEPPAMPPRDAAVDQPPDASGRADVSLDHSPDLSGRADAAPPSFADGCAMAPDSRGVYAALTIVWLGLRSRRRRRLA